MNNAQKTGFILGPALFLFILLFLDFDPAKREITQMAAAAVLMAVWWITEAIPLAATSLIPLVLFPFLGILNGNQVAEAYMNSTIFLFLGGFIIALAMEKWGLHRRIALKIVLFFGGSPNSIIVGFMAASAFISMWISNTATAVMMLPIGLAIMHKMESEFGKDKTKNFSITLMLGIAYACSIGGIATLIGTPPNLSFARILKIVFPESPEISFGTWFFLCLPITMILLSLAVFLLTKVFFKFDKNLNIDKQFIKEEYLKLGSISYPEKAVAIIFASTALLWVFRADLNLGIIIVPGWQNFFSSPAFLNDGVVAVAMALMLFIIPSRSREKSFALVDVTVFQKIPWGIILLFGGGFALATGFTETGLSNFIGSKFSGLKDVPTIVIVVVIAASINFLSELTSNTATAEMILPILAAVSVALEINPLLLMITATLSASMAFMLPAATPPNTIIFASERVKVFDMVKAGLGLNIASIIIITLYLYFIGTIILDFNEFPAWAVFK